MGMVRDRGQIEWRISSSEAGRYVIIFGFRVICCHDIAEILLKLVLNINQSIYQSINDYM